MRDGPRLVKVPLTGLRRAPIRALDMTRLCLIVVGLVYAVTGMAEEPGRSVARSHAIKRVTREVHVSKSASNGGISFSDPYGPPVGAPKTVIAQFPPMRTDPTVDQGGLSFSAGRESPDAPFTGGIKFRF